MEKIKTIGDAYMVAAGVPVRLDDHVVRLARVALEMQTVIAQLREALSTSTSGSGWPRGR